MKNILKLTLAVVCVMFTSSLFAQKIGYINTDPIVANMAETKDAMAKLEAFAKDLQAQSETLQVELNTKFQEYQKNSATMTDSVKQLKEKELDDISARIEQFNQVAQQDVQNEQSKLMAPIFEKVKTTINEVAKAGGYSVILPGNALIYADEATVKDVSKDVAAKLGVDWDKVTSEAKAAADAAVAAASK
ncbi:MAG: OmpH family outer membrane protein [Alistipes sp.]|nr:OmpH family outer membrane protein [Alistipes sp.]